MSSNHRGNIMVNRQESHGNIVLVYLFKNLLKNLKKESN